MSEIPNQIAAYEARRARRLAAHAVCAVADSWSVEHGSEFERILDAHLAGFGLRVPADEPPAVEARPDPAIRFAMWGGGVPPVSPGACAWKSAGVRGVSPWASDGFAGPRSADAGDRFEASDPRVLAFLKQHLSAVASDAPRTAPRAETAPRPVVPPIRLRPAVPRVKRHLSESERKSLELLRRKGAASLGEDFTDDELKAAFRQLAFRFHPDQHPAANPAERVELGRTFAQVHAAYRALSTH